MQKYEILALLSNEFYCFNLKLKNQGYFDELEDSHKVCIGRNKTRLKLESSSIFLFIIRSVLLNRICLYFFRNG